MPLYEFKCSKCKNVFEIIQNNNTNREAKCPDCGGISYRIVSNGAFRLKGDGWYQTDYKEKNV